MIKQAGYRKQIFCVRIGNVGMNNSDFFKSRLPCFDICGLII